MISTRQLAQYGTLDDLLFRGRNKAYGAYPLRIEYEQRLRNSVLYFLVSLIIISFSIVTYRQWIGESFTEEPQAWKHVYTDDTEFSKRLEEKIKSIPQQSKDLESIQDVIPKIVRELPVEDIPTREDIIESDALIAHKTNDGELSTTSIIDAPIVGNPSLGNAEPPAEDQQIYEIVEIEPEFPGDIVQFIQNRVQFPEYEYELGITRASVVVGFVVNEDGSLSDIKMEKSDKVGFNKAAINIVNAMPKWKPGIQNGHRVKVHISLPLTFTYDE